MNRIYKTVWNAVRGQLVVVNEATTSHSQADASSKTGSVVTKSQPTPLFARAAMTMALAGILASPLAMAAPAASAITEDTSAWTVTDPDGTTVINENLDTTGAKFGAVDLFSGWGNAGSGAFTNKAQIGAGFTVTGGVFGYDNGQDDFWGDGEASNFGDRNSAGLLRYHTMIIDGTLKDAATYHDVTSNTDKAQVGTINWLNRVAVGAAGVVNVQEVRVAEALVNRGDVTVKDLYVKDGAKIQNDGTIHVTDAVLGTKADIFDKNTIDISAIEKTAGVATFANAGTVNIDGTLTNYATITDTASAGKWTVKDWQNKADATIGSVDISDKLNNAAGKTITLTKDVASTLGAVINAGNIKTTGDTTLKSLNQTAAASKTDAGKLLNVNGTIVNAGTITAGTLAATGKTTNSKSITSGKVTLGAVDNKTGATIETTGTEASTMGAVTNAGTIDLAGASALGAVTNTGTLKLAKDATLASLNQTAGNVTAGNAAVTIAGLLDNAAAVTAKSLSFNNAASKNDAGGVITATAGVTTGSDFMNAGTINAGTAFNVQAGVSTLKGTVTANALNVAAGATVKNLSATNKFKTLDAKVGSVIENNVSMALDGITAADKVTYNQTAGSFTTADKSFFSNSVLNIKGGTLDRTGDGSRATGANTLGVGNTVNISGVTPGTFSDQHQVSSDWKAGQTLVTVGLLDSKSTVNLKSGGILEAGSIALTDKSLHMDGGALTASLTNFFEGVSEKVYKINDGTETTLNTSVLGASDVSTVKDDFKNNLDFTTNGGTLVVTDKAVSLRAIASASSQLKAMAGAGADKVNVVFTGTAAGASGALNGFYYDTYRELKNEQVAVSGSHFIDPGVVFSNMAFENKANEAGTFRDKLVIGAATAAADTYVLDDSIGFARVAGSDDVTVNGGKTFALVGEKTAGTNLLKSADGTMRVTGEGSKFVLGSKGVAGTKGVLGTLTASAKGAVDVVMGEFNVKNMSLAAATGKTDANAILNVTNLTDDASSTFFNKGKLTVAVADALNAAYTNAGTFNVKSATAINKKFLNTAGKAIFEQALAVNDAISNAKDALIEAGGLTVAASLDGTSDDKTVRTAGKIVSTAANTVAGSMIVDKTGGFVALDKTDIASGRINVLGDSSFHEINVGSNTQRGDLGAGKDALIRATDLKVSGLGALRLKEGATIVADKVKLNGRVYGSGANWTVGLVAAGKWDQENQERLNNLMGEYAGKTQSVALMSLAPMRAGAESGYKHNVTLESVTGPAPEDFVVDGADAKYIIQVDRSNTEISGGELSIDVDGNNEYSSQSDTDWTYLIGRTDGQKITGKLTLMDSAYLTEGKKITVESTGSLVVEDATITGLGYHPGFLIVRGELDNKGVMNSTNGSGVIVGGTNGVITTNAGAVDNGKTLGLTGNGTYKVAGGNVNYGNLFMQSGTLEVDSGFFGLGLSKTNAGYDGTKTAVFATNKADVATNNGKMIVGSVASGDAVTAGSVYFGADSAFVLDTQNLVDKTIFKGNNSGKFVVKDGSELVVKKATWGKHYFLADGYDLSKTSDTAWNGAYLINKTNDDMTMTVSKSEGKLMLAVGSNTTGGETGGGSTGGTTGGGTGGSEGGSTGGTTTPDTTIQALSKNFSVPAVINGLINDDTNVALRDPNSGKADVMFIERVLDKDYVGKTSTGALDVTKATQVWNSAVQLSAASGMNAYALNEVTDTMGAMEDRAADGAKAKGNALWVKAAGKYAKADKLESDGSMKGGFEAKTGGFIFGSDLVNTNNLTVGAAFSYTKGDLKSQGDFTKTDTDAEIFGGNLYGAYRIGDAALIAHAGYASAKGEAKQNYQDVKGNAYAIKGDVDSEFLMLGLRGEMSFALTKGLIVMPHAGLRYVHSKAKGYDITINGKDAWKVGSETSDIVQVPVGVALKGSLRAKNWWVSPYADVSLVQSFGDTDSKATVHATGYKASDSYSYDVTGKTAGELKLGINSSKKHHSLGLSYTGGVGEKGSQTHSVTVSYSYSF